MSIMLSSVCSGASPAKRVAALTEVAGGLGFGFPDEERRLVRQILEPEPAGGAAADPAHRGLAGAADPDGRPARLHRAQVAWTGGSEKNSLSQDTGPTVCSDGKFGDAEGEVQVP